MDIEAGKSTFITFLHISLVTQKGPIKTGCSFPGLCLSCRCFAMRITKSLMWVSDSFLSWSLMPYLFLPRLAASVVSLTTLIVATKYNLQQLEYVCFALTTMLHLLEVLTSYYALPCKAIS